MFTRWADFRGASRIISFEPFSLTYSCLVDNSYGKAECHKLAVGLDGVIDIIVPNRISNLGGATTLVNSIQEQTVSAIEKCPSMSISSLFYLDLIPEKIDFLKIDCEGGEKEILESMTDEHILRIKKISLEYHEGILGPETRESFIQRIQNLGYSHFTLFHGDGSLAQLHIWQNNS
jgi:FkbM family methyltransferase